MRKVDWIKRSRDMFNLDLADRFCYTESVNVHESVKNRLESYVTYIGGSLTDLKNLTFKFPPKCFHALNQAMKIRWEV